MKAFVGVKQVSEAELRQLLESQFQKSWYFLCWPHQIKWVADKPLPEDLLSPEGQAFNGDRELRWKQQGEGFSLLLLSTTGPEPGFKPVGKKWEVQQRQASILPRGETRYPRGLNRQSVNVAQRYFIDAETATVHFVALTLAK